MLKIIENSYIPNQTAVTFDKFERATDMVNVSIFEYAKYILTTFGDGVQNVLHVLLLVQ